jgi:hypothetical protein
MGTTEELVAGEEEDIVEEMVDIQKTIGSVTMLVVIGSTP